MKYFINMFKVACSLAVMASFTAVAHQPNTVVSGVNLTTPLSIALNIQTSGVIYKTVNADGSVTYSDQPSEGAEIIQLNVPTNTMQSNPNSTAPQALVQPKQATVHKLKVVSPQAEATIRSNTGEMSITATLDPASSGIYQLVINGKVHESPNGVFRLTEIYRGAYQYTIKFIDNSGKVIALTEPRNFYMHQASVLIN